jgi:hypothetical protein
MLKPLVGLFALAMMVTAAQSAFAAFTHYPNAGCPDTLSIFTLKTKLDTGTACAPNDQAPTTSAPGDTIYGVGGIITGFDEIPTGFDMYIQTTGGGPNTGIDVFTSGTNFRGAAPFAYNRGDSIVVEFAGVGNFQGDIELESPDNLFSNPDIIIRKVNTGNTLPPFFSGNTTDLVELPGNLTFAPYVSALVHLDGPVTVARSGGALGSRSMLVVRALAPSDSVFIDLGKLTNIIPPPVGTVIQSIQGIGNKATRGFRIMPRDADDIVDSTPPNLGDAFPLDDTHYRVVYDRSVTSATATNTSNYTLGSFGSVDAAVMDGTSAAVLTVSGTGLSHGQTEQVQVNGITGVGNGQTMSTPQSRTFLAGLLSVGEMSQPNPDTLAANPCVDKALYSGAGGEFLNGNFGPRASMTGIVTGIFGNLYYLEDGTTDPAVSQHNSRGITVFASPVNMQLGRRYLIAGSAEDFWQENEFASISYVADQGVAGVPAAWTSLTPDILGLGDPCDATQTNLTARDYLSTLVMLSDMKVVTKNGNRFTSKFNAFYVAGPGSTMADTILVENQNTVLGANSATNANYPPVGSHINVTGVVHFTNNPASPNDATIAGTFRICPRTVSDIVQTVGVGDEGSVAMLSLSAYPNPARIVNLAFSVPKSAKVDLAVYDLVGRKVATIANGTYAAGDYHKVWNATNTAGNHVGPGIYFYRLRVGDQVRTARTLLLGQ